MFVDNFYENGYLYWFVVHNFQTKISGKLLLYLHFFKGLGEGEGGGLNREGGAY